MAARKRPRKSAEETRGEILDAAERTLLATGPDTIRLQEVAREVGISHPAVLHHFGSREGLVQAVVDRALEGLQRDLTMALSTIDDTIDAGDRLFALVYEVLAEKGHGRLVAWLVLAGDAPAPSDALKAGWKGVAAMAHQKRLERTKGQPPAPLEDTEFVLVLSALTLFSLSFAGPTMFDAAGFDDSAAAQRRFRDWLSELVGRRVGVTAARRTRG